MASWMTPALAAASTVSADSGIFEVDLLFPRNTTYTPQALMPVVWAIQNPPLAVPTEATIFWGLWEGNNQTSPGSVTDGGLELSVGTNLSSSEPLLFHRIVNTASYPDGVWTLWWEIYVTNCSSRPYFRDRIKASNTIIFSTSSSSQAPDLVAATSPDQCGSAEAFAFNVISGHTDLCAVIRPSPTTTTNPCGATIDAAAASSIAAAATATACLPYWPKLPNVTCPTPTASSADDASRTRIAAASTLLMLLAPLTALIHLE